MTGPEVPAPHDRARVSARVTVLAVLALLSGCCALAYEVLFVRALTTSLGDMFYVHAALLATFLVGVGLGARLAVGVFRHLAVLELVTGLYAFVLPLVNRWLSGQPFLATVTASPTLTVALTAAMVLVPSLTIGVSIPLFSAYVKARGGPARAFHVVYNAYNFGALLSVLVVEFVLVRQMGVAWSLRAIGAINLLNGVLLLLVRAAPGGPPLELPRRLGARLTAAVVLAGCASAVYQMFFLKLFYLVFAPHRENFAVALTVTLLGLFLGAFAASRIAVSFTTLLLLVPGVIALIFACYEPLLRVSQRTMPGAASGELSFLGWKLLIGSLFALVPLGLFGGTLPALMRREGEVAHESGALLCSVSLGNAAGYLLYVLVAHPMLSGGLALALIGALAVAAGLAGVGGRLSRRQAGVAVAGVVGLAVTAASWSDGKFYLAQWLPVYRFDWVTETFKSGAESATLVRTPIPRRDWITYNGHSSIVVRTDGVVNLAEMMSGVIPALGAPRLDRALVLGVGSGITAGSVARIFRATDAVEINQAFLDMLPRLDDANLGLRGNPSATLHLADGRAFLVGREGTYDAIVNSIPAPTYYSAAKIYTVEFYARVRRALKPDGVFSTWLSATDMTEVGLITVLSALKSSFPRCDLRLMRGQYYMATCSTRPVQVRPFSSLPVQERLLRQLHRSAPWADLDELFADHRVSEDVLGLLPPIPRDNTDDFPTLEFQVSRQLGRDPRRARDPFLLRRTEFGIDPTRGWDGLDAGRAARRGGAFHVLNRDYFRVFFAPRLAADGERQRAFEAWMDRHGRPDGPQSSSD